MLRAHSKLKFHELCMHTCLLVCLALTKLIIVFNRIAEMIRYIKVDPYLLSDSTLCPLFMSFSVEETLVANSNEVHVCCCRSSFLDITYLHTGPFEPLWHATKQPQLQSVSIHAWQPFKLVSKESMLQTEGQDNMNTAACKCTSVSQQTNPYIHTSLAFFLHSPEYL